jgi:hypothetical protein
MPDKNKKPEVEPNVHNKLTVGNALNTALNPLAGQAGFGQMYYPGSDKSGIKPTLFHALALLSTYGAGAYLMRGIAHKSKVKSKTDETKKRIASYVNAEMPIVSPDPVRNPVQEGKEEMLGTQKMAMDKSATVGTDLVSALIPVVALVGGFAGGTALADKYYGKKEQQAADKENVDLKDKLDKLNYEKLMAVRNPQPKIDKTAEEKPKPRSQRTAEAWADNQESGKTLPGLVLALAGLGVGGITLGSAYFSKKYFDDRDESRERLKAVEKVLAQRAAVESEQAPVVIPQIPEKYESALNVGGSTGSPSKVSSYSSVDSPGRKKPLPKLPAPSMDVTDPSMRQLMSIGG